VLTPLFFVSITTLLRHKRYPFFCANLLVGVISVTILHSLFLANLDRYHWVMEPVMLAVSTGIVYQQATRK